MKVKLLAYHRTKEGAEYNPGAIVEFDDAEAERQVAIGGARKLTDAELLGELEAEAAAKPAKGKAS